MVAPSVFLAAASASSKVAYWVPLNSATEAPFLAPAEALAATGAEEGSGRSRFGRRGDRRARFVHRRGIDLGLGNRAHRRRLNGRLGNRSKTVIRKSLRCKKAEGCHKPCCYRKNGMGAFFHGMPFLSYRARQNAGTTFLRHYSYGNKRNAMKDIAQVLSHCKYFKYS